MEIGRILVVDDEAEVREVIKLHLEKENFNVIEAADGREAIEVLQKGDNLVNVGAILCDIRMPNVNGVEAVDFFKENAPGIPVIIITGYPDAELATSMLKKGVKDYLVKPVEKEKLVEVVKEVVSVGKDIDF